MKQLPPVYETRRERYQIDRCGPQQRAIQAGKIEFHALTKGHYPGRSVPANILPGLNSIGFLDAADMQDWGLDEHRNEGIEIVLLETGARAFVVDGRQYDLRAGDFTVTRPIQFLNRCRLESAARLLRAGDMRSVTDIAFACGFNSSQYFATVFAKRFVTTPTQYRRRAVVS